MKQLFVQEYQSIESLVLCASDNAGYDKLIEEFNYIFRACIFWRYPITIINISTHPLPVYLFGIVGIETMALIAFTTVTIKSSCCCLIFDGEPSPFQTFSRRSSSGREFPALLAWSLLMARAELD